MTLMIKQQSNWRKSNHRRCSFLSWTENIIQRLLTFSIIMTNDLRSVYCKKVDTSIIGTGSSKRCFPCSRWTIKKNTFVSEKNQHITKLKQWILWLKFGGSVYLFTQYLGKPIWSASENEIIPLIVSDSLDNPPSIGAWSGLSEPSFSVQTESERCTFVVLPTRIETRVSPKLDESSALDRKSVV